MISLARDSSEVVSLYEEHHDLIEASFPDLDLDHRIRYKEIADDRIYGADTPLRCFRGLE